MVELEEDELCLVELDLVELADEELRHLLELEDVELG